MTEKTTMRNLIARLFAEAPPHTTGDPVTVALRGAMAGSVECQLMLRSGQALAGVLTTTPEGTLMLVAVGKNQDGRAVLVNFYFDHEDVMAIGVGREMPSQLTQPRNGSPIILG